MAGREQRHREGKKERERERRREKEREAESGEKTVIRPLVERPGTRKKSMRVKLLISLTLIACSAG